MDSAAPGDRRTLGIVFVTIAALLWSTAGYFIRLLDLDVWTVLGWRAFFGALGFLAIILFRHGWHLGRSFSSLGPLGILAIPISALSMYAYVASLTLTAVANVTTMYATIPFVAAGMAYLWFGERPGRRVVIASAVSFCGIAVMAFFAAGPSDMRGNALALAMTVGFSFLLVLARRQPNLPMAPINMAAATICFAAAWPLMPDVWPTPGQFMLLALFGVTTNAIAYILFLNAGRHIPSAEAGLIGLLDVVLGPLWVYLAFAEVPSRAAMIANAIVLGATLWYFYGLAGGRPAKAGAAAGPEP